MAGKNRIKLVTGPGLLSVTKSGWQANPQSGTK
jgi:hypothetical protein